MRIFLLFILLISFWANSFAQKDISVSADVITESKFSFGYDLGIGTFEESLRPYYTQGFFADYAIGGKWLLGTALKYAIVKADYEATNRERFYDENWQLIATETTTPISGRYLEIPLNIAFNQKRTLLNLGLTNCFLINVKGKIRRTNQTSLLSSFVEIEEFIPRKIPTNGFRDYHLKTHISGTFFGKKGLGVKIKVFQSITKISQPIATLPEFRNLLLFTEKPGGFSFHLVYRFSKNMFS